ncbi:MAG: prephenate dehydratase [Pseudomonadota bacterium]
MTDPLKPLREQIDSIDQQLLKLISERARAAQEVGKIKHAAGETVYRPEREAQVLHKVAAANPGPLSSESVQAVWREIISACRAAEAPLRVAYLGPQGTYSEQALRAQFGVQVDALPCVSIDEVFRMVETGSANFGVVPVENTTEGAVSRTLDLMLTTPLVISAELTLPIHHQLLTQSGTADGITRILAHPQAYAQCQLWLGRHLPGIRIETVSSNGEAARQAAQDPHAAAIASTLAAARYNLQVAAANIQDDPNNRTRFGVVGRHVTLPSGKDQTSLILSVPNKPGAVYHMLKPLAEHGVSMTRFESRPAKTGQWEYYFYVDIEGHVQDAKVIAALEALKAQTAFFKVLGSYPV